MITGECFCGAIRYQVVGRLREARSCHCSRCRKAFSGVTLGCVNDDPKVEIGMHIFVGSKAASEVLPNGITTFEAGPPA